MTPFLFKWAVARGQSITLVCSEQFPIHLKSGIFVCRDRLLLLSRYLISFSRKYLLVLDRGISNVYHPGLSLRYGGRGFPPATTNVGPGYFHRKTEEK